MSTGSYLDDGEAQNGRGNIADPHAGEHSNEHICEQYSSRLCSRLAQHEGSHDFGYVVFGQGGGNGKPSQKKHNHGCPHGRENIASGRLRFKTLASVIVANYS